MMTTAGKARDSEANAVAKNTGRHIVRCSASTAGHVIRKDARGLRWNDHKMQDASDYRLGQS